MQITKEREINKKIVIKKGNSENERYYYVNFEISQRDFEKFARNSPNATDPHLDKIIGKLGATLIKNAFSINGVVHIDISPYEIMVSKGKAFSWDEIDHALIGVLIDSLGEERGEVEVVL